MIRRTLVAVCIGASLVVSAVSAQAAPRPQVTDAVGDGNAINGQGMSDAVPEQNTGSSFTHLDIENITWSTDKPGKSATTMTVKLLVLNPPPTAAQMCTGCGAYYVVQATLGSCSFDLTYSVDSASLGTVAKADFCAGGKATSRPAPLLIKGSSVSWVLPLKDFKDAGLVVGASLTGLHAHTAMEQSPGTGRPIVDFASSTATYRIGS